MRGPALALVLVVVLGACASSPAPSPSAAGPAAASVPAEPSAIVPTPVPGGPTSASGDLVVNAVNIDFDPKQLAAPAGAPFTITLVNQDNGVPHNLTVFDGAGRELASSDIVAGPAKVQLAVQALDPGTYKFTCKVHPNMAGALVVGG